MSDISQAIELLAVGMITVFTILTMVFFLGRFIIFVVNRYLPEITPIALKKTTQSSTSISNIHIAVLTSVVHKVTKGKGHLSHIEKIKK
jgi:Na+-transporting methylmalonyl-CoA/oxaloacetate decarboxylase gamma subunit